MREDRKFKNLIKTIDMDAEPDNDFKERLFKQLMDRDELMEEKTNRVQDMFFIKPWRYVVPLSFLISTIIRLIMGSSFNTMVFNMLVGGGF